MLIHADAKSECPYWASYRGMILENPFAFDGHPEIELGLSGPSATTLFASLAWEIDGEQTFLLGADQCRMFREMDLSGITPNDIKYPFDSFYVVLEGCGLALRASDFEEGPSQPEHTVQGVYVTRRGMIDKGDAIRGGVMRRSIGIGSGESAFTIAVWAHNKSANISDDIMFVYSLEDAKVLESVDFEAAILKIFSDGKRSDVHCTDEESEHNRRVALDVSRIVIGMCAYLECRQAVVVERDYSDDRKRLERIIKNGGKKSAKAARMLTKIPRSVVRIIDPNLRYLGQDKVAIKAHWRRAHTRLQWVGSKTDDVGNARLGTHRERRWIPATIVNADGGTPESKAYIIA